MAKPGLVHGIELKSTSNQAKCEGCILVKVHRATIPKHSKSSTSRLLQLVHSDVSGPLEVPSFAGSRYFVTFIGDHYKWCMVYTIKQKSDTFACFQKFHAFVEKHIGASLEAILTDNGGEYLSNVFKCYLQQHGIAHQLTVAYTPQQNGVPERMNRTLMDIVRSMLLVSKLGKVFWAEALGTTVYVRNRLLSSSLPDNTTPFHRWTSRTPDLSHLRVFGCKCWYVTPRHKVKKLDSRAREGVFLGYPAQSK